ncbi:MAG: HlyD family efflux transporter periplasmic adaptor subunit [Desulfovibrio sp.]|nr:HlyD family efflux transporter periplasmic adaptor subunit [Desulfovibrio sp.]
MSQTNTVQALPATNVPGTREKMKKMLWLLGILCLLLCLVLYVFFWSHKPIVSQYAMVDGMIHTVATEIAAPLVDIVVAEGSRVQKGQIVAHRDVSAMTREVSTARKDIEQLRGPSMEEIDRRLRSAEDAEDDAIARLAKVRHEEEAKKVQMEALVLEHVKSELAMRSIEASHGAGSSEYKAAYARERKIRGQMEQAKEAFERSSRIRAAMSQELGRIRYEVEQAKQLASRNRFRIQPMPESKKTKEAAVNPTLFAPIDGRVIKIVAKAGEQLAAGDPVMLILPEGQERSLWIRAWFPVTEQKALHLGMPCTVERELGGVFEGRIEEIASQGPIPKGHGLDGLDGIPVRIALTKQDGLMPGDKVVVRIEN